jgi:hypothetical protein
MAKKRKTTKATPKQKPMEFSDGKDHLAAETAEARNLEDLLGFPETNPFGVSSGEDFDEKIEELSLTELREMAVNAGVFPSGTKALLKNKLRKSFSQYTHGGSRKVVQITKPIVDPDSKQGKELLKLMQEGF